VYIST